MVWCGGTFSLVSLGLDLFLFVCIDVYFSLVWGFFCLFRLGFFFFLLLSLERNFA